MQSKSATLTLLLSATIASALQAIAKNDRTIARQFQGETWSDEMTKPVAETASIEALDDIQDYDDVDGVQLSEKFRHQGARLAASTTAMNNLEREVPAKSKARKALDSQAAACQEIVKSEVPYAVSFKPAHEYFRSNIASQPVVTLQQVQAFRTLMAVAFLNASIVIDGINQGNGSGYGAAN